MKYAGDITIEITIVCPYCKKIFTNDPNEFLEDEETEILECEKCEKKFEVYRCVTVDYRSNKNCELNNEKHEWKKSRWTETEKSSNTCKKCGYVEIK